MSFANRIVTLFFLCCFVGSLIVTPYHFINNYWPMNSSLMQVGFFIGCGNASFMAHLTTSEFNMRVVPAIGIVTIIAVLIGGVLISLYQKRC